MKLAVVLPTRGNPQRCAAILTALEHLSSGQHDVEYHLIVDADDIEILPINWDSHPRVHQYIGNPATAVNVRLNGVVRNLSADAVTCLADDVFPLAMHWDAIVALGIENSQLPAFAWQEVSDPGNVTYPIVSRKWIDALGYLFPEYFPFWFADAWIQELHELAFGASFPVVQNLPVGGRRGATRGMHELDFWFRFFDATHIERERDALILARAYDTPTTPEQRAAITRAHHERNALQLERVPEYEQAFGANQGEPSVRYCRLKDEAEAWLAMDARYPGTIVTPANEVIHGQ
jgi:hypothetical protein